jgi:hypothetical protein
MLSRILFWWLPSSIVLLGLAGCAEFDQRKGLDPIIDGTAVHTASNNKYWILNALAEDANVHDGDSDYYYLVTEAGFNYVDDQCRSYFDSLFFLERRRDELKSGLAASGATTAAILGVTHATVPSLAIVAAAFGLASAATDIVAGTYLYRLPPATTQGFVEKLQLAYRAGAAANHALINSPTSAYYQIQRYLNLCLPPAIEAEITRQISSSSAIAVPAGAGALFDVQSVGAPASAMPRARFIGPSPSVPIIRNPLAQLPNPQQIGPPPTSDPRFTKIEQGLFPAQIERWQAALCVGVDGKLGGHHSETRTAIRDYLISQKARDPSDNSNASFEIGAREKVFLNGLRHSPKTCPGKQGIVPTGDPRFTKIERGLLTSQIEAWQAALCVEAIDGKLGGHDSETRKAIRDYLISQKARDPSDNSNASFEIGAREEVFLNGLRNNPKACPGKQGN